MQQHTPHPDDLDPAGDRKRSTRLAAGMGASALLAGGLIVGAAVSPLGAVLAQDDDPSVTTPEAEPTDGEAVEPTDGEAAEPTDRKASLDEVFAGLVDDGTISQAQADTVRERLTEAAEARRAEFGERGRKGRGRHGRGRGGFALRSEVAEELGIDTEALREALRDGTSFEDALSEQGVTLEALADATTAQAEARIEEKLADGTIDEERAAELRERQVERQEAIADGERPDRRARGRRGNHRGPGADAEAQDTTAS